LPQQLERGGMQWGAAVCGPRTASR
jgi:hypothetical protein